jgi:acetyltransferase-like isoleucine patch superfamily enzyme
MLGKITGPPYQFFRRIKYRLLSSNPNRSGTPRLMQPVLFSGRGTISFSKDVTLGYFPSPFYYNGIIYLEARRKESQIRFGQRVFANNNLSIICESTLVDIGDDVLIGSNVEIVDSDFHEIHPDQRNSGHHKGKPVLIGNNVFIGSNTKILKGVIIGTNSVIANGSVVTKSFPDNVIIGGNPAVVMKTIEL